MNETLEHASAVIVENTQKMEQSGLVIEKNTQQMKEAGLIIEENTLKTRAYTRVMQFVIPAFFLALFLSNFIFFHRILRRLKNLSH